MRFKQPRRLISKVKQQGLIEEFYTEEVGESERMQSESKIKAKPKFNQQDGFVDDIQKGLQGSVMAIN